MLPAVIFGLCIGIIQGCIFGFATQTVIDNKGYYENWFWWGFFFGLIPLIVAIAKPQNTYRSPYRGGGLYQSADDLYKKQMLAEGGWKCACGKVQAAYVSTCSCGKSRRELLEPQINKKQEEIELRAKATAEISNAAAIREYKELMDAGIISQEEFEAKKKQLLGL